MTTLYYSVIFESSPTLSSDEIVSAMGVANGNVVDPADGVYNSDPLTGLSNGTIYCFCYVLIDGITRSQVTRGPPFVGAVYSNGIPILSLAGAIDITSSSLRVQVTVTY